MLKWFRVTPTPAALHLDVRPPRRPPWQAALPWEAIERVCLRRGGFLQPDEVYLFVRGREASYLVPLNCVGAEALVEALLERGLVSAAEWTDCLSGRGPSLRCWPPDEAQSGG